MAASFLSGILLISTNSVAQAPPKGKAVGIAKDLADYIQEGRKMGLNEDDLRLNAVRAGWKPNVVDDALKAIPPASKDDNKPEKVDRGVPEEYIIGEADVVGVVVYKEPEAS